MNNQNLITNLAHPGKRFQGQFVDGVVTLILGYSVFYILIPFMSKDLASMLGMVAGMIYFLFSDALPNGQSVGKRLLNIKVVNQITKLPCSKTESFLRNVTFPLGIFDWIFIFFGSHRRLGDFLAATIVVKCN